MTGTCNITNDDASSSINRDGQTRFRLEHKMASSDGEAIKFLWKLSDNKLVESVLYSSGLRRTACVSSQVGCAARCAFCASGREGLMRNLKKEEIVEQVLEINRHLEERDEQVSHVLFMGMGEPLENYENVVGVAKELIDAKGFEPARITISTVGIVEGILALKEEGLGLNLSLSLHAPNQAIRKRLIPYAKKYSLEETLQAMDAYSDATGRDITYQYSLVGKINDREEHAFELVELLRDRKCSVNLIPYNPVDGLKLESPSSDSVGHFRDILMRSGVRTTWRFTMGAEIAAGCGQLALKKST